MLISVCARTADLPCYQTAIKLHTVTLNDRAKQCNVGAILREDLLTLQAPRRLVPTNGSDSSGSHAKMPGLVVRFV